MKYPRDFEKYKYLINPKYLENFSTVEGKPITNIFNIDPENNLIEVEYDGKREWVSAAPDFWAPQDFSKLSDEYDKLQGITDPETGNLLFPGDEGYDILHMRQIRGIGNPLFGGVLRDNQYRTELTNEEANNIADAWVEQTTPGIGTILNAGLLKPMSALSLTQLIGGLRGYNVYSEENPGIFSEEFMREHPYLTMGGNLAGDIIEGSSIGKILNTGSKALSFVKKPQSRIGEAKGIGEANPQTVVRTGHRSLLQDPDNPFQTRLTRLNNKFIGDYDPSTQKLLNRPIVRVSEIRKAFQKLDPSLTDDELDLAAQTAFANRRGVHIPIGDNSGKTIGGVSVVDIKEALKYLRESGIINPNADDVGTIVAHEAGHAVKVSKFAKDLVKDFKHPDEFYTLVGQILDYGKVTKNEGISFNRLMKLTDKYLHDKKLDNGITELRKYLSNYPMSQRKDLMKAIGRFSVGLFGTYLVGQRLKQSNNNGKVQ